MKYIEVVPSLHYFFFSFFIINKIIKKYTQKNTHKNTQNNGRQNIKILLCNLDKSNVKTPCINEHNIRTLYPSCTKTGKEYYFISSLLFFLSHFSSISSSFTYLNIYISSLFVLNIKQAN